MSGGRKPRRIAAALVMAAVLAGAAAYAVHNLDLGAAMAALRRADPLFIGLASLTNVLTVLSQGQRLHALVHAVSPLRRADASEAVALGFAGSQVLPARGGEVVKLSFLSRATGLRAPTLVALITLENILNAAGLLLVAVAAVSLGGAPEWLRRTVILGAAGLAAVFVAIYRLKPSPVSGEARRFDGLRRLRNHLHEGFAPVRRPRVLAAAFGYTLVSWTLELATAMLTLIAFHESEGAVVALLLMIGVNGAVLMPVTPGQLGVYELAAVFVLKGAGVAGGPALMIALLYHLVHIVPTLSLAGLFLVRRQLRRATTV